MTIKGAVLKRPLFYLCVPGSKGGFGIILMT